MGFDLGEVVNPATVGMGVGAFFGGVPGAALGGSLGSSFMDRDAKRDANKKNLQIAREQMHFQGHMSSTAHQRQVLDMKAAGLNPILSANQTGASSAPGASATMIPETPELGSAISTAMEAKRLKQDLKNMKAQEKALKAEELLKGQQAAKTKVEKTLMEKDVPMSELKYKGTRYLQKVLESVIPSAKEHKKLPQSKKKLNELRMY